MGKNITTAPIELHIGLAPVELKIAAGVVVPVYKQAEPLEFDLVITAGPTTASGAGYYFFFSFLIKLRLNISI